MTIKEAQKVKNLIKNIDDYKFLCSMIDRLVDDGTPDCSECKHYRFGEDGRDITCHDCKWNYNDMFEEVTE